MVTYNVHFHARHAQCADPWTAKRSQTLYIVLLKKKKDVITGVFVYLCEQFADNERELFRYRVEHMRHGARYDDLPNTKLAR
jgi:hypothetical protein